MSVEVRFLRSIPEHAPVPPELHSVEAGGPFRACLVCGHAFDDDTVYVIQKAIRGTECILECAICLVCAEEMQKQYSAESKRAIQELQEHGLGVCVDRSSDDACELCGRPFALVDDYTLVGFCRGAFLLVPRGFLCHDCELELNERLSKKTRDEHDRFLETHFPGMPASLDLGPGLVGFPA